MPILSSRPASPHLTAALLIERLPADLKAAQVRLRLTDKAIAYKLGVSVTTYQRMLKPYATSNEQTILTCLRWLAAQ